MLWIRETLEKDVCQYVLISSLEFFKENIIKQGHKTRGINLINFMHTLHWMTKYVYQPNTYRALDSASPT